jgi:bacterioferritin
MYLHPRILAFLQDALAHELSAVQHYLTQSRLCAAWELHAEAAQLRAEALEEQEHAERLIAHLLAYGIVPGATRLTPARIGYSWAELQAINQQIETEVVFLYQSATEMAARLRFPATAQLFADLLAEEVAHLAHWQALPVPSSAYSSRG